MLDEDLLTLRADWRRQDAAFTDVYARLRRNRWQPHALLALEFAGAALGLAIGLWYASVAVKLDSLLFALSAAVLLLAMPAFAVGTVLARKRSLRWEEETPEDVLIVGLRRADASVRAIRVGRWQVAIIASFVVTLWTTEAMGLIDVSGFLVFYSAICAASVIPYFTWLRRREKLVLAERAACRKLLEDLSAIEG
jgi:hypothetical protein